MITIKFFLFLAETTVLSNLMAYKLLQQHWWMDGSYYIMIN